MSARARLRRAALPLAAFLLSGAGAMLALPHEDGATTSANLVPTVVATARLERGTTTSDLLRNAEVRLLPRDARADGAYEALSDVPAGVLTSPHVRGEQIIPDSIAESQVAALGPGYVAVSVRLDTQRWRGPVEATGRIVDVFAVTNGESELISARAVVLLSPASAEMEPRDDAIITLGVQESTLGRVIAAATEDRLWLAGG